MSLSWEFVFFLTRYFGICSFILSFVLFVIFFLASSKLRYLSLFTEYYYTWLRGFTIRAESIRAIVVVVADILFVFISFRINSGTENNK